jgi:ElaB/YqjD/DUF883 family membrane-anchored ribosome-binding protein
MSGRSDIERGVTQLRHSSSDWVRGGVAALDRLVGEVRSLDIQEATDFLEQQVRRRPLRMVVLAAITGMVVGSLLRRD